MGEFTQALGLPGVATIAKRLYTLRNRYHMKIKLLQKAFLLLLCFATVETLAQNIGINDDGSSPDTSAILDLSSHSKGFLIPRMTTSEREAIVSPAKGLMVYDSEFLYFFFHNGTGWQRLGITVSGSSAEDVPVDPFIGQLYYDTASGKLYIYVSSGWAEIQSNTPVSSPYGVSTNPETIIDFLKAFARKSYLVSCDFEGEVNRVFLAGSNQRIVTDLSVAGVL